MPENGTNNTKVLSSLSNMLLKEWKCSQIIRNMGCCIVSSDDCTVNKMRENSINLLATLWEYTSLCWR